MARPAAAWCGRGPGTALHYRRLGVVVKPFEPCIPYRYSIIFPRHRARSRLCDAFVSLLRHELERLSRSSGQLLELADAPPERPRSTGRRGPP